jgi:hypothetical protein
LSTDLVIQNNNEEDLILALKYKPSYKGEIESKEIDDNIRNKEILSQNTELHKFKMKTNSKKQYIILKTLTKKKFWSNIYLYE